MSNSTSSDSDGVKVYLRLLGYVKKYLKGLIVGIVTMAIFASTEAGFIALLKPLLDESILARDPDWIILVPILLVVIGLARAVFGFISNYCMSWVSQGVIKDLRSDMFAQLLHMPNKLYDQMSSGELISKMIYDAEMVAQASTNAITTMVRDTFHSFFLIGMMLWYNWRLSLMFLILAPIIVFVIVSVSKRFRSISRRIQSHMGKVTHVTEEVIEGQRVVKIFAGHKLETSNFERGNEKGRQQRMKLQVAKELSDSIIQMVIILCIAGIVYIATFTSLSEGITPGTFVAILTALVMLQRPVKRITSMNAQLQRGIAACQSIFGLLDMDKERDKGDKSLADVKGNIRLENISFAYTEEKGNVLKDISLDIPAGKTIALVGRSGSGKTSLASLIPRFYDPQVGRILIDDIDIQDVKLPELRKHIALVSQHVTLFNDTVEHNIAYGDLVDSKPEDIHKAARLAYADEFINSLPEGMQTIVGENGVLLSGGQRQRLAIARALLKDAPILILDEATSALDTESERLIQQALNELMQGRTTIVIAHRLTTIENADVILVMDQGRIVESGKHEELIAANGKYAALHAMQFEEQTDA